MNFKGISYYLSLFCFPIAALSFLNIIYSSYSNYLLNFSSYVFTLIISLILGSLFYFLGKKSYKKIDFHEQILLVLFIYVVVSGLISIPFYFSIYQISIIDSLFESFSGLTGTGFTVFSNIKYMDPTLILWRSFSQWIGGLYFLIFLVLFFSNSQFNYKLNNITLSPNKSLNPEANIKKTSYELFFIYLSLTILIFVLFSLSNVRLFNGLNLSMSLISSGGFLPTNDLNAIIKNNTQSLILIFSFLISILNIYLVFNLFNKNNLKKIHFEDLGILVVIFILIVILTITKSNSFLIKDTINVLTSVGTSGLTLNKSGDSLSLYFLFLTLIGGSLLSNSSGIKYMRISILLKASYIEILRLVKPNNIFNKNIPFSEKVITNDNIKLSFLIFISFFISLFILSSLLIIDNIDFEKSFKLSILTLTNTTNSYLYNESSINFANLLTSSKISLIIFMIIGKIELLSFFLIVKKIFVKN